MARNIIVDTGVVVGLANRRDQYHRWCKKESSTLQYPFYTCEAVLSESFHLLEAVKNGTKSLLGFLEQGLIKVSFSYSDHATVINGFIRKYADQPAGFADSCLVIMAGQIPKAQIFTLDSDFHIYRDQHGQHLPLITP